LYQESSITVTNSATLSSQTNCNMKISRKQEALIVFVAKNFETAGIYQDEIIKVGEDRFRSIKFRHTYYTPADFNYSLEEAEKYVTQKYG